MASPLVDQPGQETSESREHPDRCLLQSDSRLGEEYQVLVPIWDSDTVRIGRDPQSSFFIHDDPINVVSRHHCEVYVVVYDEAVSHVYVRDRKSSNGTFVNNIRIGAESEAGYLLEDGDTIEIHPYWTFTFCDNRGPNIHPLTPVQEAECKLFEDKYQIGPRCLGQGSDGVVYLATEVETKKQLVCKVVDLKKIRGCNAPEELRRKLQEADVLRQLQHPNVLPYVDAILSPHSLFTFTQLATGGDLWSFLYQRDVVGELETRVIIRQVLHALDYIHTKGVVHRDLKPENVLLAFSPNMACHRVMLSDFGACAVPRRSRMLTHTGTVNYQAPEIQGQPQPQTAAVDMWSLGIVALTLLTHHMDVRLVGLDRMDQQQLDEFLGQNILQLPGQFSPNCQSFVRLCLQVSPPARISAAGALCHDWLCTPETHLRHFEELERRSTSSWKPQTHLRPMPLHLPDVTDEHLSAWQQGLQLGSQLTPWLGGSQAHNESSGYFDGPVNLKPGNFSTLTVRNASSRWHSTLDTLPNSSVTETNLIDPRPRSPPRGTQAGKVSGTEATQSSMIRLGKSGMKAKSVQANDTALLPLTNFEKHLDSARRSPQDRREKVLEELRRTNATFVPDMSVLSTTLACLDEKGQTSGQQSTSVYSPTLFR
ncbi:hypothetical protein G6O67_008842 [Ophiocordyceps sinensis]|uniref:Protein kinase-like domain protein n=1 Tax=Ophiocordyceps sinensis TaxID=72228 RepID=A0A8H4LRT0_9HYPO|nr:hypothetical protein G6O67_008842 [Ophiocordyceps sinensis]